MEDVIMKHIVVITQAAPSHWGNNGKTQDRINLWGFIDESPSEWTTR